MARIGELIGPNGEVMHPKTSASVVYLEDGRSVEQVLSDDIDYGNVVFQDNSYKFDSDVEDDFAKTVVIKGQTYQNILPEPSTHILSNNKEMFEVNEGLDPMVEVVDGVSKSAILSGRTLVNGLSRPKRGGNIDYATVVSPTHIIFNHGTNDTEEKTSVRYDWFGGKMGDGVDYTLDLWILKNTMHRKTDPNATIGKFNFNSYNNGFYSIPANTLGHITWEVTTSMNNTGGGPYIETFTTCEGELEVKFVIREGRNLEPLTDHFEGMIDCKMPALKTVGKNLYSYGDIVRNGGSSRNIWETGVVVEPGETVTLSCNGTTTGNDKRIQLIISSERSQLTVGEIASGLKAAAANLSGGPVTITLKNDKGIKGYCFIRMVEGGADYSVTDIQVEKSSSSTPYEPCKFNIVKSLEEIVLRSLPGGVKDTLNLNTGEYVQRIGEKMLKGASNEGWIANYKGASYQFVLPIEDATSVLKDNKVATLNSDTIPSVPNHTILTEELNVEKWGIAQRNNGNKGVFIAIPASAIETYTVESFKQWLAQNPITVQYELATPIIKTVDLSSSGNWEKVVLDGSEPWRYDTQGTPFMHVLSYLPQYIGATSDNKCFTEKLQGTNVYTTNSNIGVCVLKDTGTLRIRTQEISNGQSLEEFKKELSQNPVTVWYQTATTLDSTQVKQPIFFKDGHIKLSSGADHSLTPTLDYQAKTSNSYVMDLMKANTRYTMKAKSASGTFTIDGTSYGAGTNGTFTTPSSMTNKLLVMSNKTNEEVMIIEGDVTSKTIPYFKGIKSAFEDESKIEVLSTGKNLFDKNKVLYGKSTSGNGELIDSPPYVTSDLISVKPNTNYTVKHLVVVSMYDKNGSYIGGLNANHEQRTFTTPSNCSYIRIRNWGLLDTVELQKEVLEKTVLQEGDSIETYEPYKSNSTKIPLLSSLRSLPTGVCDEVIINRETKKATLIQRVGYVMLNGSEEWNLYPTMEQDKTLLFQTKKPTVDGKNAYCVSDKYFHSPSLWSSYYNEGIQLGGGNPISRVDLRVYKGKVSSNNATILREYLSKDPIVVLYELATPIITEVDLEGFPYIYKDGHIFLSEGIAPTVGVEYSLNQGQRIAGQVETLQRHEKQFSKLEEYFADLVYSDYNFALLRFSEKLRQQEGDV